MRLAVLAASLASVLAAASPALGCACGCDIFDVGGSSMFPTGQGGRIFLEYDYQNQHENWHRSVRAPGVDNGDKQIETHFMTLGAQYMITADWGVQVEASYDYRHFVTTGDPDGTNIEDIRWSELGDLRVKGIYDGFLDDHSLGVTFGFKLPTGSYTYEDTYGDVDRDTELGTGSTDVLLGVFFHQELWSGWTVFAQAQLDAPVLSRDGYYPGVEFDAAMGVFWTWTIVENVRLSPLAQIIESARTSDGGKAAASPVSSGFERLLVSPGVELDLGPVMVYFDVEVPVYIHTTGDQVIAPVLFKGMISYRF